MKQTKSAPKKLQLRTQTVRKLAASELPAIVGGTLFPSVEPSCDLLAPENYTNCGI